MMKITRLKYVIVFCLGAKNIYTKEEIMTSFLESSEHREYKVKDDSKRQIIVFHCEFSKNRGPKLSRFLRNSDRSNNKDCFPFLNYPEIYLLHNGYKQFYNSYEVTFRRNFVTPLPHRVRQRITHSFYDIPHHVHVWGWNPSVIMVVHTHFSVNTTMDMRETHFGAL